MGKALDTTEKYGFTGVSFDTLSDSSYSDYNVKGYGLSLGMSGQVKELLNASAKKGSVAATSPNVYAAGSSHYALSTPVNTSGLDVTTYEIPFYQMVVSGYVPMTGESINLASDSKIAALKCIESGIAPSFMLSYRYDSSIVTSQFAALSSTSFNGLKEDAVSYIEKISEATEKTAGQGIKEYTIVSENLRVTEFQNGVKVAVNFGNTAQSLDGIEIAAKEFKVLEG